MSTAESEPPGSTGDAAEGNTDGGASRAAGETAGEPPSETTTTASQASAKPSQAYNIRTRQIAASEVHRGREGKASALVYGLTRLIATLLFPLLVDLRVEGLEHLPASGAAILASNHIASLDIPLVAFPVPRVVHYMAKAELFQAPLLGGYIRRVGAFPVRRGEGDRESLRISERLLSAGNIVGIFPEGHRSEQHSLIEAHPGVALIALRADAPVIPVAIWGSERALHGWHYLWRRPTVTVRYGPALHLKSAGSRRTTADIKQATDQIMGAIAAMLPPYYRGVYAGLVPSSPSSS